ncbi:MAG: helix-turn-helix domain-containing protein [Pseudoflavonifractor sp.]|nr:helix-turn-helix domain-containing protein [Pseudoflavonifractor sp.]
MPTQPHIGHIIKAKLDESGMPYKEFARRINCERQSLYYLFGCQSIDVERLMLISRVLGYDFLSNVYLNGGNAPRDEDDATLTIHISRERLIRCSRIVLRIDDAADPDGGGDE